MLFYFHLVNGADVLLDPEGRPLDGLQSVKSAALREARMLISQEALAGAIDLSQRIEVMDSSGEVVHRLEFADAVVIAGPLSAG